MTPAGAVVELDQALRCALEARKSAGLHRTVETRDGPTAPEVLVDGTALISFASNDYLGLANHPAVIAAWQYGAERYGVGSGASHLLGGHTRAHAELEHDLAQLSGRQRALVFSTGYMANLGVVTALAGRGDEVYEDRSNHASLIDAALLSRARLRRYPHGDVDALDRLLERPRRGRALVVSDGVFSMDGDRAPLPALADTCRRHGAVLVVDDAHGFGVIGPGGGGLLEEYGLRQEAVPVLVATFGKALGVFGAFVAGSDALIDTMVQSARSYRYTTALPPACAAAVSAALRLLREEPWRRRRLQAAIERFRSGALARGLPVANSLTAIQPVMLGTVGRTVQVSAKLREAGFLVPPIRPPTVPAGTSRLRVTLSAVHTDQHIDHLLGALSDAC